MLAPLRTYGWALASGVLMAWAFPTFHWFPLAWIGLVPLLAATRQSGARAGAAQFFLAGWVFHSIVLQWLVGNIFWAGGWAILGQQGVCLALSGYWAVMGALWSRMNTRLPAGLRAPAFGLCWVAMEWLQARLFTGFGWASFGYTQGPDVWFAQWASLGGVVLLSGVLVAVNVLACQILTERKTRIPFAGSALLLLAVVHGVGFFLYDEPSDSADRPFVAGIYQSNYSQHMKWDPQFQDIMLELAVAQSTAVARAERVDLFVWPEALVMTDIRSPRAIGPLQEFCAATGVTLYTGATRRDTDRGAVYNSSALIRPDGGIESYDKLKLAPFGEYIPFENWLSFAQGLGAGGGITAGGEAKVFSVGGRTFGPLICFEVLFAPLADQCRERGADMLVVITNLGWFGESNVLPQELEIARFRAIENRLPLVQSANTGISGVIDPWGRIDIIGGAITQNGRYITWDYPPTRRDATAQRRVGAMAVPEAAALPWPGSVRWFGRIATALGLLLAAAVFAWPPPPQRAEAP